MVGAWLIKIAGQENLYTKKNTELRIRVWVRQEISNKNTDRITVSQDEQK